MCSCSRVVWKDTGINAGSRKSTQDFTCLGVDRFLAGRPLRGEERWYAVRMPMPARSVWRSLPSIHVCMYVQQFFHGLDVDRQRSSTLCAMVVEIGAGADPLLCIAYVCTLFVDSYFRPPPSFSSLLASSAAYSQRGRSSEHPECHGDGLPPHQ